TPKENRWGVGIEAWDRGEEERKRAVAPAAVGQAPEPQQAGEDADDDADHATPVPRAHDPDAADDVEGAAGEHEDPEERDHAGDEGVRVIEAFGAGDATEIEPLDHT